MSLDLGLILAGGIVVLSGAGMAAFLIWLRHREKPCDPLPHDSLTKHA